MDPLPPLSPFDRFRLYWLKDHGFLRAVWTNFHKLDDDVWRQNHPSPARLARLKTMGAASILTLRGDAGIPSQVEADAAKALGLPVTALKLRATKMPSAKALMNILDAIRAAPKPVVIHCKSGADRTGLAATLYLHVVKGVPLAQARGQMALRYAHNRYGSARVLHVMLDAYANAHEETGIGFEAWVRDHYDPATLATTLAP